MSPALASTLDAIRAGRGRGKWGERLFIWSSLTPMMIFFIIFSFIPMIGAVYLGLLRYTPARVDNTFVGLGHLLSMWKDPRFRRALWNTFRWVMMVVPCNLMITLPTAVLIDNAWGRVRTLFRTFFFLPTVTSTVAVALLWGFIYNPSKGLINLALKSFGFSGHNWLSDPVTALPCLVVMYLWQDIGYNIVIFLAGLQGIPQVFYEAAIVDGAGTWQRFWRVTVPLLGPTILFVTVMTVLSAFQVFVPMQVMTGGGPYDSTNVMVLYIYENAFRYLKMGYGSAMAIVLFLIMLGATVIQLRVLRTTWEY